MPLTLSPNNPDQRSIAAPNSPKDPNGIAHGIDQSDVGDGVATKAARALAKANWAEHLVTWRLSQLLNSVAVPLTWAELNFTGGADTDFNIITAVAGGATPVATLTNVLANDTAATSVLTINGISIPSGQTITIMTGAASSITVGSDGTATYTSNGEYAGLVSGSNVAKTFTYTNNAGNGGKITVVIYGSLQLSYSLNVFDNGSFGESDLPNGVLTPGVDTATLSGDYAALVMQVEGDAVTRYAGAIGDAYLTFGSDDDRLKYIYQEAPLIDNVGFILRINVPTGASGRIVETIATTGGYKIEIIGSNIRATVSDGVTELVVERLMTFDEPVTMASAISDNGLLLSLSGDTDLTLSQTARSVYVPNESTIMYIGGGGAEIYGGSLYSPAEFTTTGLVTLMNQITTEYNSAIDWSLSGALTVLGVWDAADADYTSGVILPNAYGAGAGGALTQTANVRASNIIASTVNGVPVLNFEDPGIAANVGYFEVPSADRTPFGTLFVILRRTDPVGGSSQWGGQFGFNSRFGFFGNRLRFTNFFGTVSGTTGPDITVATGWMVIMVHAVDGSPAVHSAYGAGATLIATVNSPSSVNAGNGILDMIGASWFNNEVQSGEIQVAKIVRYTHASGAPDAGQIAVIVSELATIAAQANG
jgi:hypothetical protein